MLKVYEGFFQNSHPWEMARIGMPTASSFHIVGAKGVQRKESVQRARYLRQCAGELITGEPADRWKGNSHTERGKALEQEALQLYASHVGAELLQYPAFIRREEQQWMAGVSPDALVGTDGGVEVKTLAPHLIIDLLVDPRVPPEHLDQMHGAMMLLDRKWWDFVGYCPGFEPVIVRLDRHEGCCTEIEAQLKTFCGEVEKLCLHPRVSGQTVKTLRATLDARLDEIIEEHQLQVADEKHHAMIAEDMEEGGD